MVERTASTLWLSLVKSCARVAVLGFALLITLFTVTGWLYWIRIDVTKWPGPSVGDALPLDELPGHSSVPFVVFIVAFAIGFLLLGMTARALKLDRIAAALALSLGVGGLLFVVDAFCLFVVRQVPGPSAVHQAANLQPIYIAATLAGLGGALMGRSNRAGNGWSRFLSWAVAVVGIDDVVSAIVPHFGAPHWMSALALPPTPDFIDALIVPIGVLLVVTARGVSRRRHPAYVLALVLMGASVLLHLLSDREPLRASVCALIAILLFARRQDFTSRRDPESARRAVPRLLAMIGAAFVYGLFALWINTIMSDLPFNIGRGILDTARALVGLRPATAPYLVGAFPSWFPWSVMSIAAIGVIWAASIWLSPWTSRLTETERRRTRAAAVVRAFGTDSLSPFTLRHDKSLFFYRSHGPIGASGHTSLLSYRLVRGVALVSGDPVGPADDAADAFAAFLKFSHDRGWKVAILGASDRLSDSYRSQGLSVMYHGDEAVIDVATFSLTGGKMRAVRQACHRVERHGYRCQITYAGDLTEYERSELREVETSWLDGRPRKGFTMEFDELFRQSGNDALFVIARGSDDRISGFLHLSVCRPGSTLSLSSMPRLRNIPNGLTSWLIVAAVGWARDNDIRHISLNFSPFARLLVDQAELPLTSRLGRRALLNLKGALSLQLDNLLQFNSQFQPRFQPRFVAYERRTDLPLVAIAAMAGEGYLPFSGLVCGSNKATKRQGSHGSITDGPSDELTPATSAF